MRLTSGSFHFIVKWTFLDVFFSCTTLWTDWIFLTPSGGKIIVYWDKFICSIHSGPASPFSSSTFQLSVFCRASSHSLTGLFCPFIVLLITAPTTNQKSTFHQRSEDSLLGPAHTPTCRALCQELLQPRPTVWVSVRTYHNKSCPIHVWSLSLF